MTIVVQGTAGNVIRLATQTAHAIVVKAVGPAGRGIPKTGTQGQVLIKIGDADYLSEWHTLVKADVGLGNVDNTADADKPLSVAAQAALNLKADLSRVDRVDNTPDLDKPISTATQTALDALTANANSREPAIAPATEADYWTGIKSWRNLASDVRSTLLTGLSTAAGTLVTSAHSVLQAIGFLQKQVSDNKATADAHAARTDNPHGLTAAQINLGNVLNVAQIPAAEKGAANGVAPLGADQKVPATYLPSYVDDVLEYASQAAFPGTGESGKIYTALDTNKIYRWGGSAYAEISASPGSTDAVPEGVTNLYFTAARVRATVLAGLDLTVNAAITAADTALGAFGKLQKQLTDLVATVNLKANAANAVLTGTATAQRLDVGNILGLPQWTTATRPANAIGRIGYNTDLKAYEGYSDAGWSSIGGGAKGAPGNGVFYESPNTMTGDYTITTGCNAIVPGPLTINSGVTLTVPSGSVLTIV